MGRDRGPPQERRPGGRGRAPPGGRHAGSDPVREGRRPPDAVRQVHVLYAQPPAFGSELTVALVDGEATIASSKAKFTIHDASQLVVAVVAEHPEGLVGNFDLLPNQNQVAPAVVTLTPDDLPERVEAWGAIDRIVWQDVDSERLSTPQRDALRGWIAGGGRLVIAGGTAGPKTLSAFPDSLLPYRPVVTTDVPAASLSGILGQLPPTATPLPALSGDAHRRPGARIGRRPGRRRRTNLRRRARSR